MTMAVALPLRGGLVNLGGDGRSSSARSSRSSSRLYLPGPGILKLVAALAAGIAAGGLYAMLAAWGQVRLRVPMLISSLLLNYPAKNFASYLVNFPMRDPTNGMPERPP